MFYKKHKPVRKSFKKESRTIQSDKDSCDIHEIVRTYARTGVMTHVAKNHARYGDFSEIGDFQEQKNRVNAVEEVFASLPVDVREEFGNDPANFVEYAAEEENADRLRQLGLEKVQDTPILDSTVDTGEQPQETPVSEDPAH